MTDISVWLFFAIVVVYVVLKILNLGEPSRAPKVLRGDNINFVNKVLKLCPIFYERYSPPLLWGRNGHFQTFAFAKVSPPTDYKATSRHSVKLPDNSTVIFDIFDPVAVDEKEQDGDDLTIVVVPGLANGSSAAYIMSFCEHATRLGFRVVVLNHLGVLPVKLTSKRMFTYGSTCELGAMVDFVRNNYSGTRLLGVGFSLGGNILVKYLGENPDHQEYFVSAVSICQGYDITKACPHLEEWEGFRCCYNWLMTQRVKQVIKRNAKELLGGTLTNYQQYKRDKILMASSLQEIDEHFMRRMAGYQTVSDYYRSSSCSEYINNIKIPMLLLNSEDDPLVPEELLDCPKNYVNRPDNKSIFVLSQFGGHLGFYEGSLFQRERETWMDKVILQYLNAVVEVDSENKEKDKL